MLTRMFSTTAMTNARRAVAEVESGLRIAVLLWRFWDTRGYLWELGDWLNQFLERHPVPDAVHTRGMAIQSYCMFRQGHFSDTIRLAEQSLQLARALSDRQAEAFSLACLGLSTLLLKDMQAGVALLEQSIAIYGGLGDSIGQADAIFWLSVNGGDKLRAIDFSRESLRLYRELGHLSGITRNLTALALLTIWSGDLSSPAAWLEEALSLARRIGDQSGECDALTFFGMLSYWQGDPGRAIAYYQEAVRLSEKLGYQYRTLWAHVFIAYAIYRQGDIRQVGERFADCLRDSQKAGLTMAVVFAVEGMASLHVGQGNAGRAVQLFAWADAMREKTGDTRPSIEKASIEKDLAVIHSIINDLEFPRLYAEGRSLAVEGAIALALEDATPRPMSS